MPLILYGRARSPPTLAVMITAKALGVNIEMKEFDPYKDVNPRPEWFLKMNPNHTIPTLDDNGFYLSESRAIMAYLVHQYGKDDNLYPREAKQRATIDSILYFDNGYLYQGIKDYLYPPTFEGFPENIRKGEQLKEKVFIMNKILQTSPYVAGTRKTIADISVLLTIATLDVYSYNFRPYPELQNWYQKMKMEFPFYEECTRKGFEELREIIENAKKQQLS